MQTTKDLIKYASKACKREIEMYTSAKFCLTHARMFLHLGQEDTARRWALKSLTFSVGIFDPVYVINKQHS